MSVQAPFFSKPLLTIFQSCFSHRTMSWESFYAGTPNQLHFHSCVLFHRVIYLALVPMGGPWVVSTLLLSQSCCSAHPACACVKVQGRCPGVGFLGRDSVHFYLSQVGPPTWMDVVTGRLARLPLAACFPASFPAMGVICHINVHVSPRAYTMGGQMLFFLLSVC